MMGVSDWTVQILLFKDKFFCILDGKEPKKVRACHKLSFFSFYLLFMKPFIKRKSNCCKTKKSNKSTNKSKFEPGIVGQ